MLETGSKIKMVTPIGKFNMVGSDFVVTDVTGEMIEFQADFGMGYMTEDEFKSHFIEIRECYCRM